MSMRVLFANKVSNQKVKFYTTVYTNLYGYCIFLHISNVGARGGGAGAGAPL